MGPGFASLCRMPITEGFELVYEQSDSERVFFAERANCYTSGEPDGKRLLVSELYASHGTDHGDFACNAVAVIGDYLAGLDLHLPFETMPAWAARALLTPADQLEKLGLNLASSYHALKNNFGRAQWDHTLEYIRLGLGERGTGAPSAALRCWAACEGEKRRRPQGRKGRKEQRRTRFMLALPTPCPCYPDRPEGGSGQPASRPA